MEIKNPIEHKIAALHYVQERYMEEQARFKHFEDKCSKLMNSITIVIAAFCGIASFKSGTLFTPDTFLQWSNLILCGTAFFALACAWGHLLSALKIGDCPIAAKNRENADYLWSAESNEAFKQMFDCYVDATQEIQAVIDKKSKNLELAYGELTLGASLIGAFIFLSIIMEVFL